ncbi:hypothetical protein [Paenibacillus shenyangensis]|uniref:hypothetical protein n=1 Tax=Paenibacillus sp. A9 TaxID=1284352 RepID=UPI001EE76ACE|nr:hypothetical protein [Paenibacillus sp. A9]
MNNSRHVFVTAAGSFAVTIESVIGAIVSGGSAAGAAGTLYDAYKDANSDLAQAASYIDRI